MEDTNPATGNSFFGNLTGYATQLGNAAANVIAATKGPKPTAPAGTAQKATGTGLSMNTILLAGAGVLTLVLVLMFAFRRPKTA